MEMLNKETIASFAVATSRLSEDELALCEAALSYALKSLNESELESQFGASRDEVEGVRDDLREAVTELRQTHPEPQPVA